MSALTAPTVAAPFRTATIFDAVFAFFARIAPSATPRNTSIETTSVWELYRMTGGADSVRPAVMARLARD